MRCPRPRNRPQLWPMGCLQTSSNKRPFIERSSLLNLPTSRKQNGRSWPTRVIAVPIIAPPKSLGDIVSSNLMDQWTRPSLPISRFAAAAPERYFLVFSRAPSPGGAGMHPPSVPVMLHGTRSGACPLQDSRTRYAKDLCHRLAASYVAQSQPAVPTWEAKTRPHI